MKDISRELWKNIFNLLIIIFGNTVFALVVVTLIIPAELPTGGGTGIGLFVSRTFGINMSLFVFVFNILMFIMGACVLGKRFALTTLISTFYYPFILSVLQSRIKVEMLTSDRLLATIFAGLIMGIALGMVFRVGASTGGTDIPPLVVNKLFGIPVSVAMYTVDIAVILLQMFNHNIEDLMYGILLVFAYSIVIDKVLLIGTDRLQVKVISKKQQEICSIVMNELDRGVTLLHSRSGYHNVEKDVILTVVSKREYIRLIKMIQKIDDSAFIIVNRVNEVRGRGFSVSKTYKQEEVEI